MNYIKIEGQIPENISALKCAFSCPCGCGTTTREIEIKDLKRVPISDVVKACEAQASASIGARCEKFVKNEYKPKGVWSVVLGEMIEVPQVEIEPDVEKDGDWIKINKYNEVAAAEVAKKFRAVTPCPCGKCDFESRIVLEVDREKLNMKEIVTTFAVEVIRQCHLEFPMKCKQYRKSMKPKPELYYC